MQTDLKEISLSVTPVEASYIIDTLAGRPYREVAALITKIHKSATDQLKAHEDGNNRTS